MGKDFFVQLDFDGQAVFIVHKNELYKPTENKIEQRDTIILMATLYKLYKKHIKGSPVKAIVFDFCVHVCSLTNDVAREGEFTGKKVHMKGRSVKHLYDKRPAEEFEFVMRHVEQVVKFPDRLYVNRGSKTGDFLFYKKIDEGVYLCSVEKTDETDPEDGVSRMNYIVTCFRVRKESYLNNYELLRDWKVDIPSS